MDRKAILACGIIWNFYENVNYPHQINENRQLLFGIKLKLKSKIKSLHSDKQKEIASSEILSAKKSSLIFEF